MEVGSTKSVQEERRKRQEAEEQQAEVGSETLGALSHRAVVQEGREGLDGVEREEEAEGRKDEGEEELHGFALLGPLRMPVFVFQLYRAQYWRGRSLRRRPRPLPPARIKPQRGSAETSSL